MILSCFSGVDQTKYSLDMIESNSQTVSLTEAAAVCVFLYLTHVLYRQGLKLISRLHYKPYSLYFFLPFGLSSTRRRRKNTHFHLRQIDLNPCLCPRAEKAAPVLLYWVWFGSVFGLVFLGFCYSTLCFWLFVCLFFCQDSLFLYLIKIWKLNFHSFFSQPPDKNL